VGENAASIRARAVAGLGFTGARLSEEANAAPELDALLHEPGSPVAVVVVEAREDIEIARLVRGVLGAG